MDIEDSTPLVTFLTNIIDQKRCLPSQLAAELGVCHSTLYRWLHKQTVPGVNSCRKLSEYTGLPLQAVLSRIGYIPLCTDSPPDSWPEFREYVSKKYPTELDDDLVTLIENLIARRRDRIHHIRATNKKATKPNLSDGNHKKLSR